ncbi:MAG TPA: CTP synthase [Flavobacteriaceae bacterium]|nr:CTP synthase [Flavobacteriaceae bacterium]
MDTTKYIFVTGGVSSSLGKGIIAASLAKLLQARGYSVTIQKLDPYINIDSGMLNPYEHGECYVTEDGAETDLDLGHYERFLNISTSKANTVTTGKIYQSVIDKERRGGFSGKTVQVVPHITDEIKRRILQLGKDGKYDIVITEIGGTVGDIESLPYIETVRQLHWELEDDNALVIHLTLIPYLAAAGELKTKPTQHSVKTLMESGIKADILVCRTEHELGLELREKLALFCNVKLEAVIESLDASTIYEVPNLMQQEGLDSIVLKKLNLKDKQVPNLTSWNAFLDRHKNPKDTVTIGLVGKYVELMDSYKSILESFVHAGAHNEIAVDIKPIHSEFLTEKNLEEQFKGLDAIFVAPAFGERGIPGKVLASEYARTKKVPFLGVGMGMQMAVVEYTKNVLGMIDAHSVEMHPESKYPLFDIEQEKKFSIGMEDTMRLGSWESNLEKNSLIYSIYKKEVISERHRHRYEFNNEMLETLEEAGMKFTARNKEHNFVDAVEIPKHPWYLGVLFQPEYKSTVEEPHPLFISFVKAAYKNKQSK